MKSFEIVEKTGASTKKPKPSPSCSSSARSQRTPVRASGPMSLSMFEQIVETRGDLFQEIVHKSRAAFTPEQLSKKTFFKDQNCQSESKTVVKKFLPKEIRVLRIAGDIQARTAVEICIRKIASEVKNLVTKQHPEMVTLPRPDKDESDSEDEFKDIKDADLGIGDDDEENHLA